MRTRNAISHARALTNEQCARITLIDTTYGLGLPSLSVGEPLDEALVRILSSPRDPLERACLAWLAATATYPLSSQVEPLATLLDHNRIDLALRTLADAMIEVGPPARSRTLLATSPVQIDVTSVSRETLVTGIPRTVINLVRGAGVDSSPHVWSHGALASVALTPDGVFEFDPGTWGGEYAGWRPYAVMRRWYHGLRAQSRKSVPAHLIYRVVQVMAQPLLAVLAGGNGPRSCLLLHGGNVVLPEVCHGDVADRLLTWRRCVGGFQFTVLVHDLLPVTQPQWFSRSHVGDFMAYTPAVVGADRVVATTEHTAQQVAPLASLLRRPVPRVVVAALPVTSGTWDAVPAEETILPRFVCVGTIEPRKNHDTALRACIALAEDRYPVLLSLVGDTHRMPGSTKELIDKARRVGVVVDIASGLEDGHLRGLLESSVASLFLSWAEGYGLPVLESLAIGTPVVCSAVEPLLSFADVGGIIFVDPDDHLALAAHMKELITNPPLREQLAASIVAASIPIDLGKWATHVVGAEQKTATH
jgi:glycosyltransferase involved in cell wall biosynthesis